MHRVAQWLLVVVISGMGSAYGQCPSYKYQLEVAASYGRLTARELINNDAAAQNTRQETANSGADFFSAKYYLYSCLAIGAAGGYQVQQGNRRERYGAEYVTTGNYTTTTATIAVELTYIYRIHKYMDVYTFAGTGPAFASEKTTGVTSPIGNTLKNTSERSDEFVFHYCPLGIRVGGRIGGFAELGFGYKGLFSCGLSVRPGRRWCNMK